jgi:2-dehydro-3-deoxygluconokinase
MNTLAFGELLFRLQPDFKNNQAGFYVGGAEANTAASLARWGNDVAYVSRLPENELSHTVVAQLQALHIDCGRMLWGGPRMGAYYLHAGDDMKSGGVVYDREFSAFSELRPDMLDMDAILHGIDWLHWSAISPALNANVAATCEALLKAARQRGITISVDLNYRSKLWQYGKRPVDVMPALMQYCDVAMGNLWAVQELLGITSAVADSTGVGHFELGDAAARSIEELQLSYPQLETVAYTFRMPHTYFGMIWKGPAGTLSRDFELPMIMDRVGTGDSFMAGIIHGLQHRMTHFETLQLAIAAAVSKFSVQGDFNTTSLEQVRQLAHIQY